MEISDISKIDKNLKVTSTITETDIRFIEVRETKAEICGLYEPYRSGPFERLPEEIAEKVSSGVASLAYHTAGGRIRFCTDSSYVAIRAIMPRYGLMPHMAFSGSSGFDLYIRSDGQQNYIGSFVPPVKREDGYESILKFPDRIMREFVMDFPLYDRVSELYLGIQKDALLTAPTPYQVSVPVVYYGSSITQGGCASRPGTCYQAFLSRELDMDYINLGFSGSAKGEEEMARYISGLKMSAFVMDYDHNATNAEYLFETHERFFRIIREKQPDLPILIISRPGSAVWPGFIERDARCREAVRTTYLHAREAGDSKVWYLDGDEFFRGYGGRECTVDGAHPTDLGFYLMAEKIKPYLQEMLGDK